MTATLRTGHTATSSSISLHLGTEGAYPNAVADIIVDRSTGRLISAVLRMATDLAVITWHAGDPAPTITFPDPLATLSNLPSSST